jgi:hypothetical protein
MEKNFDSLHFIDGDDLRDQSNKTMIFVTSMDFLCSKKKNKKLFHRFNLRTIVDNPSLVKTFFSIFGIEAKKIIAYST